MQILDLAVLTEQVLDIFLARFLVYVRDNDDPALDTANGDGVLGGARVMVCGGFGVHGRVRRVDVHFGVGHGGGGTRLVGRLYVAPGLETDLLRNAKLKQSNAEARRLATFSKAHGPSDGDLAGSSYTLMESDFTSTFLHVKALISDVCSHTPECQRAFVVELVAVKRTYNDGVLRPPGIKRPRRLSFSSDPEGPPAELHFRHHINQQASEARQKAYISAS